MTLPGQWAAPASAKLALWPKERSRLEQRYGLLTDGCPQLAAVFDMADELGATHVLIEAPYIDYDYRSEFSQHFSRRFRPPPDRNERIVFLRGLGEMLGYCVVRPTAKPVGRTVMAVPHDLSRYVSCTAKHFVTTYGRRYEVEGYPFMSQDGEYGRCAHVAIWSVARLQHALYDTGRHSVAAIVEATGTGQLPDRTVMSGGLTVAEVRETFRRLGLPVLSYTPKRPLAGTTFVDVMCRYLDSGFPIAVNTPGHMTVLVGYARNDDGSVRWIRCDDNSGPYGVVSNYDPDTASDPELGEWRAALVALPGRIHVPAEAAQVAAERAFERELGASEGPSHLREDWDECKISGRTYAVKPSELKADLRDDAESDQITAHYLSVPTPVWAWVTEFSHSDDEDGLVLGRVMIDATSAKHDPEPIAADIDGWCVYYDAVRGPRARQRGAAPVRYSSRLPARDWVEG